MSTFPIHLAAAGCGGRLRQVISSLLRALPGPVVIHAFDPNPIAIEAAKNEWKAEVVPCVSWDEALNDSRVRWALVGSPNVLHREHVVSAFEADKNVFSEKPLATTMEDCLAMRDAWNASGNMFSFGLVLRYSPLYQEVFQLVRQGRIGKLISFEFNETLAFNHGAFIHGNWRRYRRNSGPHILEKCCHDIDIAHWLADSVPVRVASFGGLNFFRPEHNAMRARLDEKEQKRIAGVKGGFSSFQENPFDGKQDIIDNQVCILEYANGVRATFHTNCSAGLHERRVYLVGSEAGLRADSATGLIESRAVDKGAQIEEKRIVFNEGNDQGHAGGDAIMTRHLAASIMDGEPPSAGMREALVSAITCFGIDQAMEEGRVVDLTPLWDEAGIDYSDTPVQSERSEAELSAHYAGSH